MTDTPTRAPRPKLTDLSDLEMRLLAAAVVVPPFTVLFLLTLPTGPGLTASVLMYASALWLAGNGWLAQRRRAARPPRHRNGSAP